MSKPFVLDFKPGIQRDGTQFDSDAFLDALWCRWRLGQPRKMGGYRSITNQLNGLPRRIHCWYDGAHVYIHVGTTAGIQQVVIDQDGNLISMDDRTPVGFIGGVQVGFTMDAIFDTTSSVVQIVVHAAQDMVNLPNQTKSTPFIGQINATTPLAAFTDPGASSPGVWTQPSVAGGVVCVQPYVFSFDTDGYVGWSAPNLPLYLGVVGGASGAGTARISAQKIVAGAPLRGGGSQSPAAVFWSMSEVITATFIGGSAAFAFNTVSPSSSILSTDCVIEYDGLYFWVGVDRFLVFNGTVVEVKNDYNQDWFFNNLTPGSEAKTFAFKVPRYGEIWWCAAMFGATEPSHACIFNMRENCWYDTELPDLGRSAGYFAQGFRYPFMADPRRTFYGYKLWIHEIGTDSEDQGTNSAVRSYFETPWFGGPKNDPPSDEGLSFQQLEADIDQVGDLSVTLITAPNAKADAVTGPTVPLPLIPSVPQEQITSFTERQANRLTRLHIESNVLGGTYIVGRNIGHGVPSTARKVG